MYPLRFVCLSIILSFSLFASPTLVCLASAQEIDPEADTVLRNLSKFFVDLSGYSVLIEDDFKIDLPSQSQEQLSSSKLSLQRPDKLRLDTQQSLFSWSLISTASGVLTTAPEVSLHTIESPAESYLSLFSSHMGAGIGSLREPFFTSFFTAEVPYDFMVNDTTAVQYLGIESLSGVSCHRIRFVLDPSPVDFWIMTGERPLPVKVSPDILTMIQQANMMPVKSATYEVTFSDWQLNPSFADDTFSLEPSPSSNVAYSFQQILNQMRNPERLHNKPAPDFELEMFSGEPFTLSKQFGQGPIILDFWTTWCGPCRQMLPLLDEVAEDYAEHGVKVFAVNQIEDHQTVEKFIEQTGLKLPVVMDTKGITSTAYLVSGIPHLVLLDKDGLVHSHHRGGDPGKIITLRAELNEMLNLPTQPTEPDPAAFVPVDTIHSVTPEQR